MKKRYMWEIAMCVQLQDCSYAASPKFLLEVARHVEGEAGRRKPTEADLEAAAKSILR